MKLNLFSRIVDWYQARKRGERRIAPYDVKGRVYEKIDKNVVVTKAGADMASRKVGKVTVKARIIRKDGTVEEL